MASGPSARWAPLKDTRERSKLLVINNSWRLAPWAEILYACDYRWWHQTQDWQQFQGIKLTASEHAANEYGLDLVECLRGDDRIAMEPLATVGWGSNGGFQALNLALQMRPKRILLVGYDMTLEHGFHWHGKHPNGMSNPRPGGVVTWRKAIDGAAKVAQGLGIEVINCSEISALERYPKLPYLEALEKP